MLEWAGHGVAVGELEAHHAGVAQRKPCRPEEYRRRAVARAEPVVSHGSRWENEPA
ncbi:MAG: hypothetical protein HC933_07080 [Pleurocapsa sp. SU_196_0]|nr:hypothetical protein [Pleurocapsa sp. SU_196_0]